MRKLIMLSILLMLNGCLLIVQHARAADPNALKGAGYSVGVCIGTWANPMLASLYSSNDAMTLPLLEVVISDAEVHCEADIQHFISVSRQLGYKDADVRVLEHAQIMKYYRQKLGL